MTEEKIQCPNFSFFGAPYPDAGCINGKLYDLDDCDDEGYLFEKDEEWPCPFCRTEAFIKQFAEWRGLKYKDVRAMVKALKQKHLHNPSTPTNDTE